MLEPRPSDKEMATWLSRDNLVLQDLAMRHYELSRSDVIAGAVLESPINTGIRARVHGGPWRYRKYNLLVFLLTKEGMRQLTATLDFDTGDFSDERRMNYRFDAVASVEVTESENGRRDFALTLVNGTPIQMPVTFAESVTEEDMKNVSRLALQASGLTNTLRLLEGIAAEGKLWINYQEERQEISAEGSTNGRKAHDWKARDPHSPHTLVDQ
jgi:hypothetical protein